MLKSWVVKVGYIVVCAFHNIWCRNPGTCRGTIRLSVCCWEVFPGEFGQLFQFKVGRSGKVGAAWCRPFGELGVALQQVSLVRCLLSRCLMARVAWLLVVVIVGTVGICQVETNIELMSHLRECIYIDPYLWVTFMSVFHRGPSASGGHVAIGVPVVMSSVPSYWLLYKCACFRHWY